MAVKIRLRRVGAKKAPFYRVVVADSRDPRDGRFIEEVGTYNPLTDPAEIKLDAEKIEYSVETGNVREEDWANNWKQYFKPMKVGEKLLLCPTWEADNLGEEMADRIKLLIDPGMAFGSGQHETTKLCMELIEMKIN